MGDGELPEWDRSKQKLNVAYISIVGFFAIAIVALITNGWSLPKAIIIACGMVGVSFFLGALIQEMTSS